MSRIYLAAAYERRPEIACYRDWIHQNTGHRVVSRWLDPVDGHGEAESGILRGMGTEAFAGLWPECAKMDLEDIYDKARLLIAFTSGYPGRGGYHFETGYAAGLGMDVWVCGPREHVFHFFDGVRHVGQTWGECMVALKEFA